MKDRIRARGFVQENDLVTADAHGLDQEILEILEVGSEVRIPGDRLDEPPDFVMILEAVTEDAAFERFGTAAEHAGEKIARQDGAQEQHAKRNEKCSWRQVVWEDRSDRQQEG